MSNKQRNPANFPDAPGKLTDDDKCGLYESSRTDSGFISSGNLLVSGEIVSEEIQPVPLDSGIIEDKKDQDYMHLDSGVCLSESFSNLNIKSGLNDLNSPKVKQTPVESYVRSETKIKPVPVKASEDIPWKIYYEQDEDGDTCIGYPVSLIYASGVPINDNSSLI
ncbi:hypothetical protein NQ318_010484 [Aromia moschata]|uniref:Uncharacterized protein n=1 Tax=Aromia moschata TaxID=1265417 RepID=A0AAV8YCS0_9CUCU|nr:hypothetical protein NQ318_010484 [Aromia moschata]